jgi:hypothetical protein
LANTTYTGKKKRSATPAKRFPKKDSLNELTEYFTPVLLDYVIKIKIVWI